MPEVVDPPAVGDRRPTERALERGGVQLVARLGDAQQGILLAALAQFADDRQHAVRHRHAPGLAGLGPLGRHALRLSPLDDQHRHWQLDEVAHPDRPQLRPAQTGPGGEEHEVGQPAVLLRSPLPEPLEVVLAEGVHLGPRGVRPGYAGQPSPG